MPPRKTPYRTFSDSSQLISQTGRRISAYYPGFKQNFINHGYYSHRYRHPDGHRAPKPDNWEEIQQIMTQPRPSLSLSQFSDGAFQVFVDKNAEALNEAEMMTNTFPIVRGEADIPSVIKRSFGNLAPLTDSTIVDAEPDFYYGARPEQVEPRIREKLTFYIVPSTNPSVPILLNYFTEGKGPTGTRAVANRQAFQDGGVGARAMQSLQSYGQPEPVYDNNAYTITSTFNGEQLLMYTAYPTAPTNPGGRPEYHINQLRGWTLTDGPETFRQGATAYRNGRDWAKEKRDEFIDAANGKAVNTPQNMSFESSGYSEPFTLTNMATVLESDTSADELAFDHINAIPRSGKRVKRGKPERSYRENRSDRRDRYTR